MSTHKSSLERDPNYFSPPYDFELGLHATSSMEFLSGIIPPPPTRTLLVSYYASASAAIDAYAATALAKYS